MTKHQLNQGQLDILTKLYTFRFGTRDLLAASLGKKNGNPIYSRLSILERQGYIGKRYLPSYRFTWRGAEYYLLPQGLRALKEHLDLEGLTEHAIKISYRDNSVSDAFIQRCLTTYAISLCLTAQYDDLQFFTKRETATYPYFPSPLPDGFVVNRANNMVSRYFLEQFTQDMPPFAINRRLQQLISYAEAGNWDITDTPFPAVLCVAETGGLERRLRKQIVSAINRTETDIAFYTTTSAALSRENAAAIWTGIDEPDLLLTLDNAQ